VNGEATLTVTLSAIEAGNFVFRATATDGDGNSELVTHGFKVVDESVTPPPGEHPAYDPNATYAEGDIVTGSDGGLYQCKPWPYTGWCSNPSYAPGETVHWSDAWDKL
jgi:hypothetical protein